MRESLDEPISVICSYNAKTRHVQPYKLSWKNKEYILGKVDFYHKTKIGKTVLHHFSMSDVGSQIYFKIACNADTLHWTIEEFMYAGDVTVEYGS